MSVSRPETPSPSGPVPAASPEVSTSLVDEPDGRASPTATKSAADAASAAGHVVHPQSYWLWVMCLTGVDYFSTLGYQPSVAFEGAGLLAPLATVLLVLLTLLGALPVYNYVAACSSTGQGSIGMLERLVHGWTGKMLVLVLLGFAATDYVITKTLSAADAAEHMLHNPLWERMPPAILAMGEYPQQLGVTMMLLVVLGASFMRGFREVIGLAVIIVAVYLAMNVIVLGSGLIYLLAHSDLIVAWWDRVQSGQWHLTHVPLQGRGPWTMLGVCLLIFPKLALGLSGFETGVAVMPLVRGEPDDDPQRPAGRIRNARKLLITAALIMSVLLLASSVVTTMLIDPADLRQGGPAANRALAFLAHGESKHAVFPLFGEFFGTLYDISTVTILSFAGASAMAGLLNLVPQYLPRYGMAPEWARATRPLVLFFTAVNLFVTYWFRANVQVQSGAYATGVLVLMSSACVATIIDRWRNGTTRVWWNRVPWGYFLVAIVFFYTTGANMIERPDGIKIASCFIGAIVASSFVSRWRRSLEMRFEGFEFVDSQSRFLWDSMKLLEFPVLVPHRPGNRTLDEKEENIRWQHRLTPEVPIVYIEAEVGDPSEFHQHPLLEVQETQGRFIVRVTGCASIAHVIATIALELSQFGRPPEIHFGWSNESPVAASMDFLLFGEGNVPWMVRELVRKAQPDPNRQPQVFVG